MVILEELLRNFRAGCIEGSSTLHLSKVFEIPLKSTLSHVKLPEVVRKTAARLPSLHDETHGLSRRCGTAVLEWHGRE